MESLTQQQIKAKLTELETEHRDLDVAIESLVSQPGFDQIRVQRMKKRKLAVRDEMSVLQNQLLPDIIA